MNYFNLKFNINEKDEKLNIFFTHILFFRRMTVSCNYRKEIYRLMLQVLKQEINFFPPKFN